MDADRRTPTARCHKVDVGSTHSPARRPLGVAVAAGAIAVALALLVPIGTPRSGPVSPSASILPNALGRCGGAVEGVAYTGTLGVEGGPTPGPSVVGQTIQADFDYETIDIQTSGTTYTCTATTAATTTGTGGQFSINLTVPAGSGCTSAPCVQYAGPYTPISFGMASGDPAGYFLDASVNRSVVTLDLVAGLASTQLEPFGRTTVSVTAPVVLTATPLAGDGTRSPASVSFNWTISAPGWDVLSGVGTDRLTVEALSASAGVATIDVYVNGSFNSSVEHAAPVEVDLTAVPTTIVGSSVSPTSVDVGAPTTFKVYGSGSDGYHYFATIYPGLGAAPVNGSCTTSPVNGGLVSVSCIVAVTYATTGTAAPSANLSNGYSTSSAVSFGSVVVSPGLVLEIAPAIVRAYVGATASIGLSVVSGTGTGPFGPACFWPYAEVEVCQKTGGPSWTFDATWGFPGSFNSTFSVADAAGANQTATVASEIAVRPNLPGGVVGPGSSPAGTPMELEAEYTGGALPATYWWNDSLPRTTVSGGVLSRDGAIDLNYSPLTPGVHSIELTVVDGLGTVSSAPWTVIVTAGPTVRIVATGPTSLDGAAGTPIYVDWAAVDPEGQVVPGYSPTIDLGLVSSPGGAVPSIGDDAAGGPVAAKNGVFALTPGAWARGYLNLSFSAQIAGNYSFVVTFVTSPIPISDAPNGTLVVDVSPNTILPVLSNPVPANAGPGVNHTLYRISDQFGNPYRTGVVNIETVYGGANSWYADRIIWNGSVSTVWVNFTLPVGVGGVVYVYFGLNDSVVLASIAFAAPATASPWVIAGIGGLGILAVGCLAVGIRGGGRRSSTEKVERAMGDPPEGELQRFAAGRAHVLARADPERASTLADLIVGWTGPAPDPAELADWVGSLVAEGALSASVGDDGTPRFRRVTGPPVPPVEAPPRIEIDPAVLEAALARRPTRGPAIDGPSDDSNDCDPPTPPR